MRIAIVSSLRNHIECVGFLLDCLLYDGQNNVSVFVPDITDHGYEDYFKSLYEFELYTIDEYNDSNFDVCIKVSAHDRNILTDIKKRISIVHAPGHDDKSVEKIVLSPYVKPEGSYTWMMSTYRGRSREYDKKTKKILWIGQLEDDWIDDDTINFIKKVDMEFTFVISSGEGRGEPLKKLIESGEIKNAEVINDMDTLTLIKRMEETDLILCRKIPFQKTDRYSGVITLALSHNIPMIINKKFAFDYRMPGITFKDNYSELITYLNSITLQELKKHSDVIKRYTRFIRKNNSHIMKKILNSVVTII